MVHPGFPERIKKCAAGFRLRFRSSSDSSEKGDWLAGASAAACLYPLFAAGRGSVLAAVRGKVATAVREAQRELGSAPAEVRDRILLTLAALLEERREELLAANARDLAEADATGLALPLLRRLELTESKLTTLRQGVKLLADLGCNCRTHLLEDLAPLLDEELVGRADTGLVSAIEKAEVVANVVGENRLQFAVNQQVLVGRGGAAAALDNYRDRDSHFIFGDEV